MEGVGFRFNKNDAIFIKGVNFFNSGEVASGDEAEGDAAFLLFGVVGGDPDFDVIKFFIEHFIEDKQEIIEVFDGGDGVIEFFSGINIVINFEFHEVELVNFKVDVEVVKFSFFDIDEDGFIR
ncbi:MAG: hypothetical protein ACTSPQ_04125 [Candidatus Helarchaeota archaeon]